MKLKFMTRNKDVSGIFNGADSNSISIGLRSALNSNSRSRAFSKASSASSNHVSGPSVVPKPGLDDQSLLRALVSIAGVLILGLVMAAVASILGFLAFKKYLGDKVQ